MTNLSRLFRCLAFGLFALTGLSAAQESQSGTSNFPSRMISKAELHTLELTVAEKINLYRGSQGLPPLTSNDVIVDIARQHSKDMARGKVGFGHDGFQQRAKLSVQTYPQANAFAENVFELTQNFSADLASSITDGWLKSPHHHENIVGNYTVAGLGAWQRSDGTIFLTQFFLKDQP